METAGWCGSAIRDWMRYARGRCCSPRLALLVGMLLGLSLWPSRPGSTAAVWLDVLLAGALVLQYRLWDDLADRELDRVRHPGRWLCRVRSVTSCHVLLGMLAAANLSLVAATRPLAAGSFLIALQLGMTVWYWWRRDAWGDGVLNYHVVLLKYPLIVSILAWRWGRGDSTRLFASMLLAYLVLCVHECLHDPRFRTRGRALRWAIVESSLLALLVVVSLLVVLER